jgi:hypothetical protein
MTSDLGAKTRLFRCGDTVRAEAEQESFRSKRNEKCESSQTSGGTTTKTQDITIARFQAAYQSRFAATFCRCGQTPSRAIEDNGSFRYAFRELAQRYYPDRVGPGGIPFLRNIVEAYQVLSDYERRNYYDLGLRHAEEFTHGNPVLLHSGPDETLFSAALPVAARFLHDPQITWPSLELVRERVLRNFMRAEPPIQIQAEAGDVQLTLTLEGSGRRDNDDLRASILFLLHVPRVRTA